MSFAIVALFLDKRATRPIDPDTVRRDAKIRLYYAKIDDHVPLAAAVARVTQLRRPLGHLPGQRNFAVINMNALASQQLMRIDSDIRYVRVPGQLPGDSPYPVLQH